MKYAIIAAGEGSRLAKEGFQLPKPMVTLSGEMMIDRLIGIFMRNRAERILIIINENSPELEAHLNALSSTLPLDILIKSTPSSLHSAFELLDQYPETEAVCLTTTDTVFKEEEFGAFIDAFENNPQLEGQMAVTAFVDDESPLYISADQEGKITAFTDSREPETQFVSGGIYCLRQKAINTLAKSVNSGTSRMRNFQRELLLEGIELQAYPFSKIVDVDHISDIQTAEMFLNQENLV
ncbi:hypothetical protein DYBT9623_01016 [Dyadobacter sp. CECT 9623]|uniref:Nucleotidyl transferase domain-containing protein n=1 Tax=Dyadobacter linearis TaxID=2823330 RepID=A0ABM8ULG3_9BACT|nr:sugar phosphate nucleotidyltransferase [Dyadobacter sp. CECT 9623]CAG5068287.1 hypothetical protein DYBT9623_01016 [Dyadobacter sp. CECT 9623]